MARHISSSGAFPLRVVETGRAGDPGPEPEVELAPIALILGLLTLAAGLLISMAVGP